MKNSLNNREINLRLRPKIELEIEKFTDEEIESF